MIDNQQLTTHYASFMENMRLAEPLVWVQIQQRTINKADFTAAMRRWATDITKTEEKK